MHLVKIPRPPPALLPSALLNQPLDLVHSEVELLHSAAVGVHSAGLLLGHRELMFSDQLPQVRGALLVLVVRFLDSQNPQRPLVPLLQVRRIIFMSPYPGLYLPIASTDANPPPVTTGTSTPAYSVFSEKDPSNPSTILQYQTITASPAYRGTSLEVGQCNSMFYFHSTRSC